MWLARKPKGKLAAPPKQRDKKSIIVFFYHDGYTRRCHAFIRTICFSYFVIELIYVFSKYAHSKKHLYYRVQMFYLLFFSTAY